MDGIIVLNKPERLTSMNCCAVVRGVCHEKHVGHTGTLDPCATGVLPICLGKATRLIEYLDGQPKTYIAGCRLGITTDTQDIWGTPIVGCGACAAGGTRMVDRETAELALNTFSGDIEQIPPMYSAIKFNGQKLYNLARCGQTVERQPRKIHVYSIRMLDFNYEAQEFSFEITCSRGTYVRTICADLGEKLGTGAVMSSLVRSATCGYTLDDAVTLEELKLDPLKYLKPFESAVSLLKRIDIEERQVSKFVNGNPGWPRRLSPEAMELVNGPEPVAVFGPKEDMEHMLLGIVRNGAIEKVISR